RNTRQICTIVATVAAAAAIAAFAYYYYKEGKCPFAKFFREPPPPERVSVPFLIYSFFTLPLRALNLLPRNARTNRTGRVRIRKTSQMRELEVKMSQNQENPGQIQERLSRIQERLSRIQEKLSQNQEKVDQIQEM
ncbi:unnamed protein product, partial [Gongylonema pulchrum]|uniref:Myelin regulatory factor n=1 Tax=Gongylonema pulchrum TaxID=637853 RepID=A0A183E2P1_9BILA